MFYHEIKFIILTRPNEFFMVNFIIKVRLYYYYDNNNIYHSFGHDHIHGNYIFINVKSHMFFQPNSLEHCIIYSIHSVR